MNCELNKVESSVKSYEVPLTINLRGRLVEFSRPWVMGILNLTPDSFFPGSRTLNADEAVKRARAMLEQGADIIDIGACSTRPGSEAPTAEEELRRLEAPLEAIRRAFTEAIISVDTFRSSVARECLERWGVDIINDISGGDDPDMYAVVAAAGACYVMMHRRGTPADMDSCCEYETDVTTEVVKELAFRLDAARRAGLCNVIVDPGFGFAKTSEQNYELLAHLERLRVLECPILVGLSRKRMVRDAAGCDLADALIPTVAMNAAAILNGANIIRVHDVAEGCLTAKAVAKLKINN